VYEKDFAAREGSFLARSLARISYRETRRESEREREREEIYRRCSNALVGSSSSRSK